MTNTTSPRSHRMRYTWKLLLYLNVRSSSSSSRTEQSRESTSRRERRRNYAAYFFRARLRFIPPQTRPSEGASRLATTKPSTEGLDILAHSIALSGGSGVRGTRLPRRNLVKLCHASGPGLLMLTRLMETPAQKSRARSEKESKPHWVISRERALCFSFLHIWRTVVSPVDHGERRSSAAVDEGAKQRVVCKGVGQR